MAKPKVFEPIDLRNLSIREARLIGMIVALAKKHGRPVLKRANYKAKECKCPGCNFARFIMENEGMFY